MRRRQRRDQRILFPWELRVGFLRWLLVGRLRAVAAVVFVGGVVITIVHRESRAAGIRETRATLVDMRRAVDTFLADRDGACPARLEDVLPFTKRATVPRDAWGNPLRLICPGKQPGVSFELMSDGPDGVPGGLDRIE
jgi:general secretion pathway protein G